MSNLLDSFSIPSSFTQHLQIEDKNFKIREDSVRDTNQYIKCKSCGGLAISDIFKSTDKFGNVVTKRTSRCIEKIKCGAYVEVLKDNESDMEKQEQVDINIRVLYNNLPKVWREWIAKTAKLPYRYIGFAMRKSRNASLLTVSVKERVSQLVIEANEKVKHLPVPIESTVADKLPKGAFVELKAPESDVDVLLAINSRDELRLIISGLEVLLNTMSSNKMESLPDFDKITNLLTSIKA